MKPIRDYDIFVGKTMEFKVVKINQEFKNVVVSHKALIEAEPRAAEAGDHLQARKGPGAGRYSQEYHILRCLHRPGRCGRSYPHHRPVIGRVSNPSEVVELDQKLNVVILDFDSEKKRIALGLKQLMPHPWDALDADLKVGDKVNGRVVVMADYGAFLEIAPGVEGLIHVSEMSWKPAPAFCTGLHEGRRRG